jgi:D-lactate dehydrogenase (cytochrome)
MASVVADCDGSGTPVTVSGARTGIVGGAVPLGGAVLSTEQMKRILRVGVDRSGSSPRAFAVVEPGLTVEELSAAIEGGALPRETPGAAELLADERGWFYPPDPTERSATLGGTVATNASGARTFFYGPTRRFVRAMRALLACGEVLELRRGECPRFGRTPVEVVLSSGEIRVVPEPGYARPAIKNVAGYYSEPGMELIELFIGSEGTLGVVSEIELALLPRPFGTLTCLAFTGSEEGALALVRELRGRRARPLAIEFFDGGSLDLLRAKRSSDGAGSAVPEIPPASAGAHSAVEFELAYSSEEELDSIAAELEGTLGRCGSSMEATWAGFEESERRRIREARHALPEAVNALIAERKRGAPGLHKVGTDMAVPPGELERMLRFQEERLRAGSFEHVQFGHIGDGHLHVNILPRDEREMARAEELYMELAREAVRLGGTVAAEHGIGKVKPRFLEMMCGADAVERMRRVKRALDPGGILGRGNLFEWKP